MQQLTLCSRSNPRQANAFATPLCNIEDKIKHIDKIFVKDAISTQDVSEINQIYREVKKLEKRNDRIAEQGYRGIILEKIISKVKALANIGTVPLKESSNIQQANSVKNLISLYHLKDFSDKSLPIEKCFNAELRKIQNDPQILKDIATYLPLPNTLEEFDQSIAVLIGNNPTDQLQKILDRKKRLIENHHNIEEKVQERKQLLANFRAFDEDGYPSYLDELLDNRYIHLFDHLIKMNSLSTLNDRELELQNMTACEASHVILEIRDAIIRKVEKEISAHYQNQNILFLLGEAGAGKSTTFCFLRGDKMERKGDSYLSKSDKEDLIGHSQTTSCTFFPAVENVDGWLLVDFPGFDDTHGSLISLGMEFAQKALIKKYQPKILILHSISNTGNRCNIPAQLGSRLGRLLDDKTKCTLGFTKYSEQPDFKEIEIIEGNQKKKKLKLSQEEQNLVDEIEAKKQRYSEIDSKNLPPNVKDHLKQQLKEKIDKKQQELEELQNRRTNNLDLPLSETISKTDYRKKITELEEQTLKQSGLVQFVKFDQLENLNNLSSYFVNFSDSEPVSTNSNHSLDPSHEKLIVGLLLSDLMGKMETMAEYDGTLDGIESFHQKVNESSLINTVFSSTHPEIGEFLHLPEMDPSIVENFDKKIVKTCVDNYMDLIISEMDMFHVRAILKNMRKVTLSDKISTLEAKFEELQKYVMGIKGVDFTKLQNSTQIDAKWNEIQLPITNATANKKEEWKLPLWAKIMGGLALGIPLAIHNFMKMKDLKNLQNELMERMIDECCSSLEQMLTTLKRLKGLEEFVNLREGKDKFF